MSAWTQGVNVPDVTIRLKASPSTVTPEFSFGCGSSDGTASCDLGAMDASASPRQLLAQVSLPISAQPVTSVALSVVGGAANLPVAPVATATVAITGLASTVNPIIPSASPLPVGSLPNIPAGNPSLSPGGNAGNLFPTLDPASQGSSPNQAIERPVANAAALPGGASVIGAQLAGLAALALGFVLAVTRLTVRRRPPGQPAKAPGGSGGTPGAPAS